MPRVSPVRLVFPTLLLVLGALAACDRTPRTPAKATAAAAAPAATASIQSGAVSVPMAPATVALSGAIRDLPPATTPDAATPPARGLGAVGAAVRPPPPVDTLPRTVPPPESAAMRDFRAEQERRDRELLERDLREAREGLASRERGSASQAPQAYEYDPRMQDDRYREPEYEDRYRDEDPPLDDPSYDEEPAPEDQGWNDEEPPPGEDEELRWDPATGTWR